MRGFEYLDQTLCLEAENSILQKQLQKKFSIGVSYLRTTSACQPRRSLDSDHFVTFSDDLLEIIQEIIHGDHLG